MAISRRLSSFAAVALTISACAGPVAPDLVITNARVFTNDPSRPWAEALAIKGERVIAVGDATVISPQAGPSTRVVDAGGRVVVPGFNDARVELPAATATPEGLANLEHQFFVRGVTSLQVVADRAVAALVDVARASPRRGRWRLIRSPEDSPVDVRNPTARQDDEPFLPPQPGARLLANGVAWHLGRGPNAERRPLEPHRIDTVVGWAYGAEDPMVMSGDARPWVASLSRIGLPDVWKRKRPRLDIDGPDQPETVEALARLGVTVAWMPAAARRPASRPEPFEMPRHFAGVYADAGVVIALGTGAGPWSPLDALAAAVGGPGTSAAGRPLTREEAVRAMTWGSAYAERAERDKGWFVPGTLADVAVLSDDIFTVPDDHLAAITSVLTIVGGAIVYDPGVLR